MVLDVGHLLKDKQSLESGVSGQREAKWRLFEIRQRLSDRLLRASLDVSSSTAEIDCEESRIQHVVLALKDERDKKETRRTLIAIVGDAMVGVVAGAFGLATQTIASEAAAILGGSLGAGFGIAAALVDVEHQFDHQESLLNEIWKGSKESHLFPHRVWRYLNLPMQVDREDTRREAIIDEWKRDGLFGEPGSEVEHRRVQLFFGAGGIYKYEELEARLQMIDIVKVYLHQMNQSLQFFSHEVLGEDSA